MLSFILPNVAAAKLYKCIDAAGEVVYTDQACEGEGKELKLPPSSTYTPSVISIPIPDTANNEAAKSYKSLEIITPKNDKLITSTEGTTTIGYKIEGPLLSALGHRFGIALDGEKLKPRGVTNQIRLDDITPGTHTVRVFVVDKADKELISSATTKFHMRRQVRTGSPTPGDIPPEAIPGAPETDDDSQGQDPGRVSTIPGSENTIPGGLGTIPGGRR